MRKLEDLQLHLFREHIAEQRNEVIEQHIRYPAMGHESSKMTLDGSISPRSTSRTFMKASPSPSQSPSKQHTKRHHDSDQDDRYYDMDRPLSAHHQNKQFKFTPTHSPDIKCLDLGDLPSFSHIKQLPTPEQSRPTTPGEFIRRGSLFGLDKEKVKPKEPVKLSVDCFDKLRTLGTGEPFFFQI